MKSFRYFLTQIAFVSYLLYKVSIFYSKRFWKILLPFPVLILIFSIKAALFPPLPQQIKTNGANVIFTIPRGESFRDITAGLVEQKLLTEENKFLLLGRISGYQNRIKAGTFIVPHNLHPWHLLNYLLKPETATRKITFPEGINLTGFAGILQKGMAIDSTEFMALANDSALARKFEIPAASLEGYLLPETYYFPLNATALDIIELLVNKTLEITDNKKHRLKMADFEFTRHQLLTMASIIEGEAVIDSERVLISSVYHNRLNKGWRLQADPTIQYFLPGKPRRLLYKHLAIDSPYNTYLYKGLPPGPINNPGKNSILAALYPAETSFMYFVATGDGGHNFARTAAEHAKNKKMFDAVRRKVRRSRRR